MTTLVPSKDLIKSMLDKGLITESPDLKKLDKMNRLQAEIGEFTDVLAVAYGLKDLAGIDFSAYGRSKFKKKNKAKINAIIDFCNKQGVQSVYNFKVGGGYIKNMFYLPHNEQKALNLMAIIWLDENISTNKTLNSMYFNYYIGKSFGYSEKNTQFFLQQNFGNKLTDKQLDFINSKILSDNYTLADLNEGYKMKIKPTTKLL
jgi:hypothetical protein